MKTEAYSRRIYR